MLPQPRIVQAMNFFALPCSARCPPGICNTRYPQKNIPAANPATAFVIPNA